MKDSLTITGPLSFSIEHFCTIPGCLSVEQHLAAGLSDCMENGRMNESYLRNCVIQSREPRGEALFYAREEAGRGLVVEAALDSYAIIPREVYEALLPPKSGPTAPPSEPSST